MRRRHVRHGRLVSVRRQSLFGALLIGLVSTGSAAAADEDAWHLVKVTSIPAPNEAVVKGGGQPRAGSPFPAEKTTRHVALPFVSVEREWKLHGSPAVSQRVEFEFAQPPREITRGCSLDLKFGATLTNQGDTRAHYSLKDIEMRASIEPSAGTGIALSGGPIRIRDAPTTLRLTCGSHRARLGDTCEIRFKTTGLADQTMTVTWHYRFGPSVATPEAPRTALDTPVVLDANPRFVGASAENASDAQLLATSTTREGTTADGVSQLLIRVRATSLSSVDAAIAKGRGSIARLRSIRHDSNSTTHYFRYTPPDAFGGGRVRTRPQAPFHPNVLARKTDLIDGVLETEPLIIEITGRRDGRVAKRIPVMLRLARVPVVLVHGLWSTPLEAWIQTFESGLSFASLLERSGLMPFLVCYEKSSGRAGDTRPSGLRDNASVIWDSPDEPARAVHEYDWYLEEARPKGWLGHEATPPPLSDFQRVKATRIGGIKQALAYYRDKLNLAATQADLIGHSMGGLLARAYAATPTYKRPENFNAGDIHRLITICTPHYGSELVDVDYALAHASIEGESWRTWARRTLGSWLMRRFLDPDSKAVQDMRADPRKIEPRGKQLSALRSLGPTEIPSFSIAATIGVHELGAARADTGVDVPAVGTAHLYQSVYGVLGLLMYQDPAVLRKFAAARAENWRSAAERVDAAHPQHPFRGSGAPTDSREARRQFVADVQFQVDAAAAAWEIRRSARAFETLQLQVKKTLILPAWMVDRGPMTDGLVQSQSLADLALTLGVGGRLAELENLDGRTPLPREVLGVVHDLIFHGDPESDGAVRLTSQVGGCKAKHVFRGISHSVATWSYPVIRKSIDLLKWDDHEFANEGFPVAGRPMPCYLPARGLSEGRVTGRSAIDWSGMVASHAEAYGRIADERDVVVLVRPVNPDSTALIDSGAATKGMAVKGKSSNWGPQKGLICVDQRFSKIWRVLASRPKKRDAEIKKYNKKVVEVLKEDTYPKSGDVKSLVGKHFAVERALELPIENPIYRVLVDPKEPDAEDAVYLQVIGDGNFAQWRNATTNQGGMKRPAYDSKGPHTPLAVGADVRERLQPMMVLADNTQPGTPKPYLTADYDLLAIGFKEPGGANVPDQVKSAKFDPLRGACTRKQLELIVALNDAVQATGYLTGWVTHHGPENQYRDSPYIDYPILAIDAGDLPQDGKASIQLIRMGPVGFRDIHLKRYFAEKIRQGYNLFPNDAPRAGWLWEARRPYDNRTGFAPRDAVGLPPYVSELSRPTAKDSHSTKGPGPTGEPKAGAPPPGERRGSATADAVDVTKLDPEALRKRAEAGDQPAMVRLGRTLLMAEKYEEAIPWFTAAAAKGSLDALNALGWLHEHGLAAPKDIAKAVDYFRRAAEGGIAKGQYNLGRMYLSGKGVPRDHARALTLIQQAAEQGFSYSEYFLGHLYATGQAVDQSWKDAAFWYRKAADQGLGVAQSALGLLYQNGTGAPKNMAEAVKWYAKSVESGDAFGHRLLAAAHLNGTGVPKDYARAKKLLEAAIAKGDTGAHYVLAHMHRLGLGVEQSGRQAFEHYVKASDVGIREAHNWAGHYLASGEDVPKDEKRALAFFLKGADAGDRMAQSNAARAYRNGLGTSKDLVEAYARYSVAVAQGLEQVRKDLDAVERQLSNSQVTAAQARSRELFRTR